MDKLIEEVAQELFSDGGSILLWEQLGASTQERYRLRARRILAAVRAHDAAAGTDEGLAQTNQTSTEYRPGLDQVIDQRNRIVAREIPDPACSDMRDDIVLTFDILLEVLGEHFPLMSDTKGEAPHDAQSAAEQPVGDVVERKGKC